MEKPMTLCDRCEKQLSCLLDYDGVPCRKNRTVEPTNYDRIITKTPEELAMLLGAPTIVSPPWCDMNYDCPYIDQDPARCDLCALDWLRQEAKECLEEGE